MPRVHSIVAAGGEGVRFGGETPKQFLIVAGRTVLDWSIDRLLTCSETVVIALPERLLNEPPSSFRDDSRVTWVGGGRSRWRSVRRALAACAADPEDLVAVHDGARPALAAEDLAAVLASARATGAAVLGRAVADTIKRIDGRRIVGTVDRTALFRAETPQVFRREILDAALAAAANRAVEPTDEAAAVELLRDVEIAAVAAATPNPKVTEPGDLELVRLLLERSS